MPAPGTETRTTSTSDSTGTERSSQAPILTLRQQGKRPVSNQETGYNTTASTDQTFPPSRRNRSKCIPTHYIILDNGDEIGITEGTVELTIERKGRTCILMEKTRTREEGGEKYSTQEETSKKDASTKDVSNQDTVVTCKLGETGDWTWSEQWSEQ